MNRETENYPQILHPGIIEKYRFLPGDDGCASRQYQILPDGYFDLAFLISKDRGFVMLAGPYTRKAVVPINNFELFAIRFRIGNAPDLTDIKPSELVDTMVRLPGVFGMSSDQICEILLNEKEFAGKQKAMEDIISKKEIRPMAKSKVYRMAASLIEKHDGRIKVKEIAGILDVSIRKLERQFEEILGLPPKQFIRLVRFQKTVEKLKKLDESGKLTDIAYESGYFDQAHFIKDFKSLSGQSPFVFSK